MIDNRNVMHKSLFRALFVMVLIPVFLFGFLQDFPEYSLDEALKVLGLIDKLQLEQLEKGNRDLKNVVVTEDELNSYIAHRIKVEQEEILRELQLKMFDDNNTEWKIMLDFEGAKLPKVLKAQMTFYLRGRLEVKEGNVRLDLKDLYLGNQRIQVTVLELVIFIGSKIISSEPFSMSDWWPLPYGIKDIKIQKGKAAFFY
jgi:hypothetical protein